MTGWGSHALHGGATPQPQPGHDGVGAVQYPYAQHLPVAAPLQPAHAQPAAQPEPVAAPVAGPTIVSPEELATVAGPPRYALPTRTAVDPQTARLAAVLAFIAVVVAIWAMMSFLGSLSHSLANIAAGNERLKEQLGTANKGLAELDVKTGNLDRMSKGSTSLAELLGRIDTTMGGMLTDVDRIGSGMGSMNGAIGKLDSELAAVNTTNAKLGTQLATINDGLKTQVRSVTTMRRDVSATGGILKTLPGRLRATNGRLAHVNGAVDIMGCGGIAANMQVLLYLGPLRTGSANVSATIVPRGAWGTDANGRAC